MRMRIITSRMQAVIFVAMLVPLGAASKTVKAKPPEPLSAGPFPVGVLTTVFVDDRRTDSFTKQPRTLVTEIWYPATDGARRMPKNKYSDFVPGGVTPEIDELIKNTYKMSAAEMDKVYWNESHRNAPVRKGRYPLVVFSHGNGGTRNQNTFWCDYLASHGYIIVSADHTGNARWTIINGRPIVFQGGERSNSAKDRPLDVAFLLDQMIRWDKGADRRFAGHIDTEHAAVAGMSFGAFTAHWAADQEPRFKAVIAMSGAPASHTNLTVPSLRMLGTEDRTLGEAGNKAIRDNHVKHTGPSYLLELKNGGHYSFTDMFKINSNFGDGVGAGKRRETNEPFEFTSMETTYKIINSYSVAFLGYFLKGKKGYVSFLSVNHWPDVMTWDVKDAPGESKAAAGAVMPNAHTAVPKMKITRARVFSPLNPNPLFNQSDLVVTVETDAKDDIFRILEVHRDIRQGSCAMTTKKSSELTLKDLLSRLTCAQECKLLGEYSTSANWSQSEALQSDAPSR